jgi:hypothetical protein
MTRAARRAVVGTIVLTLAAGLGLAPDAQAGPQAAGAVSSFAYISTARQGAAVYANALIKQNSPTGVVRSANRTAYLQRNLDGHWQTVLSRVTNASGTFAVGFISTANYQYRYVVMPSAGALGATSAAAQTVSAPVKYSNCAALNVVYPYGVGRSGAVDHTRSGAVPVRDFIVSSAVYSLNPARDADKDGIACERH